ncbi:hypothetical protein [Leisingera sp. JC1]|uniref:hypothetical protein n=1 Tax=Leisingera sp. JC1 TaxID=1855282 RepID=UPI0011320C4B|nr:hypothetical protein [Leisingera sp. JC1]
MRVPDLWLLKARSHAGACGTIARRFNSKPQHPETAHIPLVYAVTPGDWRKFLRQNQKTAPRAGMPLQKPET